MMHEQPGAKVYRNVLLPTKNRDGHRRQVEVLVVGSFAGYPEVRVIECKNYGRNINVQDIGGFRDLLDDIGYAPHQGILISASKIGAGAQSRARELGIKVFELKGLTADRLSSAIHEATQRVVFAVPALVGFSIVGAPGAGEATSVKEDIVFVDGEGHFIGALPDLVWLRWLDGEPDSVLGEHRLAFETEGWHHVVGGELLPVFGVEAGVKVHGATLVFPGKATGHALVDPGGLGVQKFKANASFDLVPGQYPVQLFDDEAELE